jgi:hypothetical protein
MRTANALLLGAAVAGTTLQQASAFIGAPMLPRTSVAPARSASRVAARPHMVAVGTNVEKVAGSDKEGLLDTSRMERSVLLVRMLLRCLFFYTFLVGICPVDIARRSSSSMACAQRYCAG